MNSIQKETIKLYAHQVIHPEIPAEMLGDLQRGVDCPGPLLAAAAELFGHSDKAGAAVDESVVAVKLGGDSGIEILRRDAVKAAKRLAGYFCTFACRYIKATPHNPCASVCATSTGVEAQIFVRLPKFDAALQAKFTSLYATARRIDVIFDDVGNHDGKYASR